MVSLKSFSEFMSTEEGLKAINAEVRKTKFHRMSGLGKGFQNDFKFSSTNAWSRSRPQIDPADPLKVNLQN